MHTPYTTNESPRARVRWIAHLVPGLWGAGRLRLSARPTSAAAAPRRRSASGASTANARIHDARVARTSPAIAASRPRRQTPDGSPADDSRLRRLDGHVDGIHSGRN